MNDLVDKWTTLLSLPFSEVIKWSSGYFQCCVHCKEYSYYIWIVLDYMMCVFQLLGAVTGHWQSHKHVILSILSEATGTFLDFYLKNFCLLILPLCLSPSLLTNTSTLCRSQSATTSLKHCIVRLGGGKEKHYQRSWMRWIAAGTRRFMEIIFLKLFLPICRCSSLSDLHISVSARLLSVVNYLTPRGSFIHMHALFKVIRYDTPHSGLHQ